jgi:hypothetical protein
MPSTVLRSAVVASRADFPERRGCHSLGDDGLFKSREMNDLRLPGSDGPIRRRAVLPTEVEPAAMEGSFRVCDMITRTLGRRLSQLSIIALSSALPHAGTIPRGHAASDSA